MNFNCDHYLTLGHKNTVYFETRTISDSERTYTLSISERTYSQSESERIFTLSILERTYNLINIREDLHSLYQQRPKKMSFKCDQYLTLGHKKKKKKIYIKTKILSEFERTYTLSGSERTYTLSVSSTSTFTNESLLLATEIYSFFPLIWDIS